MREKCPTCFGTGRRPDVERSICMFCDRTTADEGVRMIFTTDGSFGLVQICNICVREADGILEAEEAKNVEFKPRGERGTDPFERDS